MAPITLRESTVAPLKASARATIRAGAARRVAVVRAFRDSEDAKASLKETSNEVISSISTNANEFADKLATYWEESEDKPTIVAVGFGAILALYFIDSIVSAVDRLPLISNAFELIGIAFSGWTAYRYFLAGEKETMNKEVKNLASKVGIDL